MNHFEHHDPREAFEQAIRQGKLSADPTAPNYAGHYMYMGHFANGGPVKAQFKHIDTRQYLR